MRLSHILASAITTVVAATGLSMGVQLPAAASGSMECTGESYNAAKHQVTYECDLFTSNVTNEVWSGPGGISSGNGHPQAFGVCNVVSPPVTYTVTVTYLHNGTPDSASTRYTCTNAL